MNGRFFNLVRNARKRWCQVIFAVVILGFAAHAFGRVWSGRTDDFGHFYRAARGMLQGENIYTAGEGRYVYPAFLAFILQPLALLPETWAGTCWILINIVLIFAAARVVAMEVTRSWLEKVGDQSLVWIIAAATAVLASDKIHAVFTQGQSDFIMLLGFACVLRWMEEKPWLAGLAVGLSANIKYFSLIFVPYFIWKGRYRAALGAIGAFLFFLFLPMVELGTPKCLEYIAIAAGGLAHMAGLHVKVQQSLLIPPITWEHSVSITSAVFRMTRGQGWPDLVAVGLTLSVFAAVMLALFVIAWRNGVILFALGKATEMLHLVFCLEWAILIGITIAFSPQATARHMLLSFLLMALGIGLGPAAKANAADRVILSIALLAMAGATSFPPRGIGLDPLLNEWRWIGGAGWCALFLLLALVFVGSREIRRRKNQTSAEQLWS